MALVANGGRIAKRTLRSITKQAGAKDFDECCKWIDDNCSVARYERNPVTRSVNMATEPFHDRITADPEFDTVGP